MARCAVLVWLAVAPLSPAYSILTHEAVIGAAWDGALAPLLLRTFSRRIGIGDS